jgi:hypothetical protein
MAPDDRDRTFEKALGRRLHSDALGEADASHPGAEILAAYHERLLPGAQITSWKTHIAGCARCQEILAQLEATDELPLGAGGQEREFQNVVAMPGQDFPQLAQAATQAPAPAEPRTTAAERWARRFKMSPGANWHWLAPAGVLAAGLLLWVSFHENKPPKFQLAKNEQRAPLPQTPTATPQPSVPANTEAPARSVPSPSASAQLAAPGGSGALRKKQLPPEEKKPTVEEADRLSAPRALSRNAPGAAAETRAQDSAASVSGGAEEAQLQKQAAPSTAPAGPEDLKDSGANALSVAPASQPAVAPKAKFVGGGREGPQAQKAAAAVTVAGPGLRETSVRAPVIVAAPDANVSWRLGPAGVILHSVDAGSDWTPQASGVVAELLAGSAPTDTICWSVGRSGTILRTIDGGAHWLKVSSPTDDDLTAVFAIDAERAVVSGSMHKTYKSEDGGQTWIQIPPR